MRVDFINNTPTDRFLDFLSMGNAHLRQGAIAHWKGSERTVIANFGGRIVDLAPHDNPEDEFKKFYEDMQKNIDTGNINMWSAKLYTAIIFAHLFPDANGRLARNIYALVRNGKLLDENLSSKRSLDVAEYALILSHEAVVSQALKDGVIERRLDDQNLNTYAYLEDSFGAGDDEFAVKHFPYSDKIMKYFAAKKVLESHRQYTPEQKHIVLTSWSPEDRQLFDITYKHVRKEWFWNAIDVVEQFPNWCVTNLDKVVGIANAT